MLSTVWVNIVPFPLAEMPIRQHRFRVLQNAQMGAHNCYRASLESQWRKHLARVDGLSTWKRLAARYARKVLPCE